MRSLALWAVVGLLSVVCTQATIEDDVLKEVETDGFLVQQTHHSTESTKKATTPNPPVHEVENSTLQADEIEGSAEGNYLFIARGSDNQTVFSSMTSSPTIGFSSVPPTASTPRADEGNSSSVKSNVSLINDYILDDGGLYEGSGDPEYNTTHSVSEIPAGSKGDAENSTVSHANNSTTQSAGQSQSRQIADVVPAAKEISQPHPVHVPQTEPAPHKGHVTPDWIIILGFIVGVAALITLCAAIATRDKWNGPSQTRRLEPQAKPMDQQREQEMTTYLLQQAPRVNGKAGEYTVIPLEDLPERC